MENGISSRGFQGRVAGRGIGRAIAELFVDRGASVSLASLMGPPVRQCHGTGLGLVRSGAVMMAAISCSMSKSRIAYTVLFDGRSSGSVDRLPGAWRGWILTS